MAGSLTVIGGVGNDSILSGLVTTPSDQTSLLAGLQSTLTSLSGAVTAGTEFLTNVNVIGGTGFSGGTGTKGILEITNTDSVGGTTAGSANYATTVGSNYNALIVQAPGDETIAGNGSANFLAIFGSQSAVDFTSNGGSGTVVASTNNLINVSGQGWSVYGAQGGADTINTGATSAFITTAGSGSGVGPANVIGLAGVSSTVESGGTGTVNGGGDLIAAYGGNNVVSISGQYSNFLLEGGSDTVTAVTGAGSLDAFFFGDGGGGKLDFINSSGVAVSVTGGSGNASGSVTVFGGMGGGYYQGGANGNNSLVGGLGSTTLIGGGGNNFISAQGGAGDALFASANGNDTVIAGASTSGAQLSGGTGTDILSTSGSGNQNIFAGTIGSETITGSHAAGAVNYFYFNGQSASTGGGTDVITNFRLNTDFVSINFSSGDVTITGGQTVGGGAGGPGTEIFLSDNTTIKLAGVSLTQAQITSITGSTNF